MSWIVIKILIVCLNKYFSTLSFKLVARQDGGGEVKGREGAEGWSTKKCTPRRWVSGGMPKYCFTCYINFVDVCFQQTRLYMMSHLSCTKQKCVLRIIFCWVILRYASWGGRGGGWRGKRGEARRKMKVSQPAEGRSVRGPKENFQTSEQSSHPQ